MKKLFLYLPILLFGCVPEPDFVKNPKVEQSESVYGDFNFALTENRTINLSFTDQNGAAHQGIKIELKHPDSDQVLFKGVTNSTGQLVSEISLPTALDRVIMEANYIGIPNRLILPIQNKSIKLDFRGAVNLDQVISYEIDPRTESSRLTNARVTAGPTIKYAAAYDNNGVPANLEPTLDYISASVLQNINASLPESQPVPQFHPTYLADGKKTTLDIVEQADVWLTFVHEGAGWRNSIGFYTYTTSQPPRSLNDISSITVLFPNLSAKGSGGNLKSGQKVRLGRFEPGTSVGIVLLANGWNGSEVKDFYHTVFADKNLNPEPDAKLKQHNVLLWDEENKLFLLGFEDVRRDDIPFKCDQDFNDAILFVSSNPVRAISTVNVSPVDKPGTLDRDGDGINDNLDEYPDDATKAYDSYYPSATSYGSFAFEDNWPEMGDYDFNDLVVDYQFRHTHNSANKVVEFESKFKFRAIGAGFRNGFGFGTELSPSDVKSVTGQRIGPNLIKNSANGTESNQTKAVIIVTDNAHELFGSYGFVNTDPSAQDITPVEVKLTIKLNAAKLLSEIGAAPYNPFLIVSQDRGREVHLPSYKPTSLASAGYFGTANDNTNPGQNRYYTSKTSLPWAIHIPESFDYPKEKTDIRGGHLRFDSWAKSTGYTYMDWYRPQTGYRDNAKLFKK